VRDLSKQNKTCEGATSGGNKKNNSGGEKQFAGGWGAAKGGAQTKRNRKLWNIKIKNGEEKGGNAQGKRALVGRGKKNNPRISRQQVWEGMFAGNENQFGKGTRVRRMENGNVEQPSSPA